MDSCVTLNKGRTLTFSYQGFFDLILGWSGYDGNRYVDDIDLCLFYKAKNNTTGGIFNRMYRSSYYKINESEGSLGTFPFVLYIGEVRPKPKYIDEEIVRVRHLNEFEAVYVVAIDYFATINNEEIGFTLPITLETIETVPTLTLTSQRSSSEKGTICILAMMKQNNDGTIVMNNVSKYILLSEACELIPGFSMICE